MAFVQDTFTDADATNLNTGHTGETGADWTRHSAGDAADFNITANRANGNGGANTMAYASGVPATAEYDVEAPVFFHSVASSISVCGRMDTTASTLYMGRLSTGRSLELYKRVSGTFTLLASLSLTSPDGDTGTTSDLKIEIRDATKKVFWAGVEKLSSSDNAITAAGRVGLRGNGQTTGVGGAFVSITATDAGAGDPTLSPGSIASAEAFGTAVVTRGDVTASPSGIASAEAFGTAVVSTGDLSITVPGIASAEAFGTARIDLSAIFPGIASAEAFGTAVVTPGEVTISPTGIASGEAFGIAVVTGGEFVASSRLLALLRAGA